MLSSLVLSALLFPRPSLQSPPSSAWNGLNATVKGRLFQGVPFALPCYNSSATDLISAPNATQCALVQAGYLNDTLRASTFGAYINTQWETCQATGEHCLLDETDPSNPLADAPPAMCARGSVPPMAIDVREASDVIAAYVFAKQHRDISLVVKNSGHDYKGRSGGPNTLALWVHNLKGLALHTRFVPEGCSPASSYRALTMGAGISSMEAITFADSHNTTIPTGSDPTVALAGGYTQGGGHSTVSNALGLAVDRVLQYEIVTPNGQHLVANDCHNKDLFFALRGGGGGTFGVVLKMTTIALPQMSISGVGVAINPTHDNQRALLSFMINNSLELSAAGWGGVTVPQLGTINFGNPIANQTAARASIATLESFVQALGGNFTFAFEPDYKTFYANFQTNVGGGHEIGASSRLVPVSLFQDDAGRTALYNAIEEGLDQVPSTFLFAQTPLVFGNSSGTSVTPAWRNSLWHVVVADEWNFNSTVPEVTGIYKTMASAIAPLRRITPTAAYQNEADVYEPEFTESFWAFNYERLLSIKAKYDPDHLLDCWQCVGWLGHQNSRYSSPIIYYLSPVVWVYRSSAS